MPRCRCCIHSDPPCRRQLHVNSSYPALSALQQPFIHHFVFYGYELSPRNGKSGLSLPFSPLPFLPLFFPLPFPLQGVSTFPFLHFGPHMPGLEERWKSNLVHFSLQICHLVSPILPIFLKINLFALKKSGPLTFSGPRLQLS